MQEKNDYNRSVSGSSETVLTDLELLLFWSELCACNFADIFHAQTASLHNKEHVKMHDGSSLIKMKLMYV